MRECTICGKEIPKKNKEYCSRKCMGVATTGENNPFYGKHHTLEDKGIMRAHKIDKPLSDTHKKHMSEAHQKNLPLGEKNGFYKHKHTLESRVEMITKGHGRPKTLEHRRKIGMASSKRIWKDSSKEKLSTTRKSLFAEGKLVSPNKDKPMSVERKKKLSISQKMRYEKNPALREINRQTAIRRLKEGNTKFSNTRPEIKIRKYLESIGLVRNKDFMYQEWINSITHKFVADFTFPKIGVIIEEDGVYHHANDKSLSKKGLTERQKKQIVCDDFRTKELRDTGKIVLRFWSSDVMKNFSFIEQNIKKIFEVAHARR